MGAASSTPRARPRVGVARAGEAREGGGDFFGGGVTGGLERARPLGPARGSGSRGRGRLGSEGWIFLVAVSRWDCSELDPSGPPAGRGRAGGGGSGARGGFFWWRSHGGTAASSTPRARPRVGVARAGEARERGGDFFGGGVTVGLQRARPLGPARGSGSRGRGRLGSEGWIFLVAESRWDCSELDPSGPPAGRGRAGGGGSGARGGFFWWRSHGGTAASSTPRARPRVGVARAGEARERGVDFFGGGVTVG